MLLGGSFPQPDSSTSPQLLRLMLLSKAALVFCIFSAHPHLFIILYYQEVDCHISPGRFFLLRSSCAMCAQETVHNILTTCYCCKVYPMSFDLFPKLLKICHTVLVLSLSPAIVLKNGVWLLFPMACTKHNFVRTSN